MKNGTINKIKRIIVGGVAIAMAIATPLVSIFEAKIINEDLAKQIGRENTNSSSTSVVTSFGSSAQLVKSGNYSGQSFENEGVNVEQELANFVSKENGYEAGLEQNPYIISNAQGLESLSKLVNLGYDFSGKFFKVQLEDGQSIANLASLGESFAPIGTIENPFNACFDGNGTNITINSNTNGAALFGVIGTSGIVKNLSVAGYSTGDMKVGSIASENNGTIQNCYSTAQIKANRIAGGIVGVNNGVICDCYFSGLVICNDTVGGIAGQNFGNINNCCLFGIISNNSSIATNADGIVGTFVEGSVQDCYYDRTVLQKSGVFNFEAISKASVSACVQTSKTSYNLLFEKITLSNNWINESGYYPKLKTFTNNANAEIVNNSILSTTLKFLPNITKSALKTNRQDNYVDTYKSDYKDLTISSNFSHEFENNGTFEYSWYKVESDGTTEQLPYNSRNIVLDKAEQSGSYICVATYKYGGLSVQSKSEMLTVTIVDKSVYDIEQNRQVSMAIMIGLVIMFLSAGVLTIYLLLKKRGMKKAKIGKSIFAVCFGCIAVAGILFAGIGVLAASSQQIIQTGTFSYTAPTATVTFYSGSGSVKGTFGNGLDTYSSDYVIGLTYNFPTMVEPNGYHFLGWKENASDENYLNTSFSCVASTTFTAYWQAHNYVASYGNWSKYSEVQHSRVVTYTCACGASYTETEYDTHTKSSVSGYAQKDSTNHTTTYTCAVCNNTFNEDEAHNFAYSYSSNGNGQSATHTVTATCSNCGYQATSTAVHAWDSGVIAKYSETQHGTKYTCTMIGCGATYWANLENHVQDIGFTVIIENTNATVHTYTYKCSVCTQNYNVQENHNANTLTSCVSNGASGHTKNYECSVCGRKGTGSITETHNYGNYSTTGTTHTRACLDCGYENTSSHSFTYSNGNASGHTKTCSVCGYSIIEAHTYGAYTTTATTHSRTCQYCSYVDSADHTFTYSNGNASGHTKTCSVCGYSTTEVHSFGSYSQTASQHSRTCSKCGYISQENHTYENWSNWAVNTQDSTQHIRTRACTVCEYVDSETHTANFGNWGDWASISDTNHQRERTCTCGIKEYQTEAHNLNTVIRTEILNDDDYHTVTYSCSVCNRQMNQTTETHTYGSWSDYDFAYHRTQCSLCGHYKYASHNSNTIIKTEIANNDTNHAVTYYCDVCNRQMNQTTEAHTYGSWSDYDATNHRRQCSVCSHYQTENHNSNRVEKTEIENDDDYHAVTYYCSVCNRQVSQTTEAHSYGDWISYDSDFHRKQCSVCNHYEYGTHDSDNEVRTEIENDDDYHTITYYCSVCDEEISDSTEAHTYGSWSDYNGTYHRTQCSLCEHYKYASHDSNTVVRTEILGDDTNHTITYYCSVCSRQISQTTEAHTYSVWINFGSTTQHSRQCLFCSHYQYEAHEDSTASLDDESHMFNYCYKCGYYSDTGEHSMALSSQKTPTQHVWVCIECEYSYAENHTISSNWAEYDDPAAHEKHCTICNYTMQTENHTWGSWSTSGSNHVRYCTKCSASQRHAISWGSWTNGNTHTRSCTGANCTVTQTHSASWGNWQDDGNGYTHSGRCSVSGCTLSTIAFHSSSGNNWSNVGNATYHYKKYCTTCGYYGDRAEHDWRWIDSDPTNGVTSTTHRIECYTCGYTKNENHNISGSWIGYDAFDGLCGEPDETYHYKACTTEYGGEYCAYVFDREEHEWGDWITSGNWHTRTCSVCSYSEAHAISWGNSWSTLGNRHIRYCTGENCDLGDGHTISWAYREITDPDAGLEDYVFHEKYCSVAGCSIDEIYETHTYGQTEGACDGYYDAGDDDYCYYNYCVRCGYYEYREDHYYHWDNFPPTCTATTHGIYCSNCCHVCYLSHEFSSTWNRWDDNYHYKTCTTAYFGLRCGYVNESEAHTWSNWTISGSNHVRTCTVCNYQQSHAINWGNWSGSGFHTGRCTGANCTMTTGHIGNFDEWEDYDDDYHVRSCNICSIVEYREHYSETFYDDYYHYFNYCDECGHYSEIEDHDMSDFEYYNDNVHKSHCYSCGYTESEKHSWEDWDSEDYGHSFYCEGCGEEKWVDHDWSTDWLVSGNQHWRCCDYCGHEVYHNITGRSYSTNGNGSHTIQFTCCDYEPIENCSYGAVSVRSNDEEHWRQKTCRYCGYYYCYGYEEHNNDDGYDDYDSTYHWTNYECSICGHDAGHSLWVVHTLQWSYESAGTSEHECIKTCRYCDYRDEWLESHEYGDNYDNYNYNVIGGNPPGGQHYYGCVCVCGEVLDIEYFENHHWDWSYKNIGGTMYILYECYDCGATYVFTIGGSGSSAFKGTNPEDSKIVPIADLSKQTNNTKQTQFVHLLANLLKKPTTQVLAVADFEKLRFLVA